MSRPWFRSSLSRLIGLVVIALLVYFANEFGLLPARGPNPPVVNQPGEPLPGESPPGEESWPGPERGGPATGGTPQRTARRHGPDVAGKVVHVSDGDTIDVLDSQNNKHRIRFFGIDAPETSQDFGTRSKAALAEKISGRQVRVEQKDVDQYSRIVGKVFLGDRDINREMVAEGYAWHYRHFDKSPELDAAEANARERRLGLWQDANPEPPWDYRRHERDRRQTPRR